MSYLRRRKHTAGLVLCIALSYNLYFAFLLPDVAWSYLWYLDALLAIATLSAGAVDYFHVRGREKRMHCALLSDGIIASEFSDLEGSEIAAHDAAIWKERLRAQYEINCDLQDFITRWCHEVKIPLSASLLMVEKAEDDSLKDALKEQLEKINRQLNFALLGCKVQSSLFDLQIRPVGIADCVKASIRNNQYFLIRSHFRITIDVEDCLVCSDPNWLVYMLDQMISNAIKYATEDPALSFSTKREGEDVLLLVEDHGEGIKDCDIRRIFDRGYTGSGHHNGKYKSTGMGLYMAKKIADKLGHVLSVESEWGSFTRFCIQIRAR